MNSAQDRSIQPLIFFRSVLKKIDLSIINLLIISSQTNISLDVVGPSLPGLAQCFSVREAARDLGRGRK